MELGTHGFFVCYAPADDPKIAMVVFLDRSSGPEATTIASSIIKKIFIHSEEPPQEIPEVEEEEENVEVF